VLLAEPTQGSASENLPQGAVHGDAFARVNPVPYEPTRFNRYWPDVHESLGDEIWRKTTITYGWRTPWGTVVKCKTSLILLGVGGCGWGPAPSLTIEQLKALRAPDLLLPPQPSADDPPPSFDPLQPQS
jgi:hypothetical protein